MDFEHILYSEKDGTALITINRPSVYNALSRDAKLELIQAVRTAGKSESVRSIILTGEGKAFSSGQDLNDRTVQGGDKPVDLGYTLETEWNPLSNCLRDSKKIVIAAVNGVCAGAGLSVALSCDLIVSKPSVKFVSGFSKLGLAPDAGSSFTFVRALGYQRTLEFFLFNKPLMAEELLDVGLINVVDEDFMDVAWSMAKQINTMAPLSLELIKTNVQKANEISFAKSMENETATQRFLGSSKDYKEGLAAFFDKRAPDFKGE